MWDNKGDIEDEYKADDKKLYDKNVDNIQII